MNNKISYLRIPGARNAVEYTHHTKHSEPLIISQAKDEKSGRERERKEREKSACNGLLINSSFNFGNAYCMIIWAH